MADQIPQMDLVFLGTASMMPGPTRNVSGIALRVGVNWWIFDCGEGTQHQTIRKEALVSTGSISRIFITHLHGDHCFGLPGLLCKMGSTNEAERLVEIVGPPGLRTMIRNILKSTYTGLMFNYTVHELHGKPGGTSGASTGQERLHSTELMGQDVTPEADGSWLIPSGNHDTSNFTVRAARLRHSVPTMGFIIQERSYPGTMNPEILLPRLEDPRNVSFLKERGVNNPKSLLGRLKQGQSVELHDGTVEPSEVLGPEKQGRKVVVLGDTCDSSAAAPHCCGCDVLVHEATNAFLPEEDRPLIEQLQRAGGCAVPNKGQPYPPPSGEVLKQAGEAVLAKTVEHGHSTPEMAGKFAADVRAKQLVLTHFSARYKGDDSEESLAVMAELARQASAVYSGPVHTASDFWVLPLPYKKDASQRVPEADDPEEAEAAARDAGSSSASFSRRALAVRQQQGAALEALDKIGKLATHHSH